MNDYKFCFACILGSGEYIAKSMPSKVHAKQNFYKWAKAQHLGKPYIKKWEIV